jgi:signal transduction histidine kinase
MRPRRAGLVWTTLLIALGGACRDSFETRDEQDWRIADTAFRQGSESGDSFAFELWERLDGSAPRGRLAHQRLLRADAHYRRGIELFRTHQSGVREAMQDGLALAPIDPVHYLTLARLCAERGNAVRAADFYRKYIAHARTRRDAAQAQSELTRLEASTDPFPLAFVQAAPPSNHPPPTRGAWWLLAVLPLPGMYALWKWRVRRRLAVLLVQHPEWQQVTAYHLGCLRHEFFKHRIGPLAEPLRALASGMASLEKDTFLRERLGRQALLQQWRAQLHMLERSLGLRWRIDAWDPVFRRARVTLKTLDLGRFPLSARRAHRMLAAHGRLMAFDRDLSELLAGLARCKVDQALLVEVVESIRSEWAAGRVALDDLHVGHVPADVEVDVLATDLRIVLRNVLRNAIYAVANAPPPRRVAIDVRVDLEPTGEELVVFCVRDTSPQSLTWNENVSEDVSRGLGIVATALRRYDGSLQVRSGSDGYAKEVLIRFFHSQRSLAREVAA